jgi:membrane protein YqaA with SNARE-associated domain
MKGLLRRKKVLFSLFSLLAVILVLSLTIGKQLIAGEDPSLTSFAIIHFAGYLFFLLMPVESLVPFYQSIGHNSLAIFFIAIFTAIIAQPINYAIGYLMSAEIIEQLIGKKRFTRVENYIVEYGAMAIFFFNLLPLSSSILSLLAGMLRYRLRNLIFFSFAGLILKYVAIIYLFQGIF